jgi:hypothetical protein
VRRIRPRTVSQIILLVALTVVIVGVIANLGGTARGGSPPTPIADCIVDKKNDVAIGGPKAPEVCKNNVVQLVTSLSIPQNFGEITIGAGGTLTVVSQAAMAAARASLGGRLLQRLGRVFSWSAVAHAQAPPVAPSIADICIENNGTLQIGTAAAPITAAGKVVLNFIGNRSEKMESRDGACRDFSKGIDVTRGGTLLMYGAKGVPQPPAGTGGGISWTTLSAPAGLQVPGAAVPAVYNAQNQQVLQLTDDVTQGPVPWQPRDWIVVGTTSFNPFETEFVQIASVTSLGGGGSTITLVQPLAYYHFGSLAPSSGTCVDRLGKTEPGSFCDDATHNYGVDERAEVGLISRDIELTGVVPSDPESLHWGGEIMIHPGFKQVAIQGVRLSQFGKDQLGSYPIHFHKIGEVENAPLISANSIDHSYNKCLTIHSSSNLSFQDNVCARIVGHIFYEELDAGTNPAADSGITFTHNLGVGAMSNSFDLNPVTLSDGITTISRAKLIEQYWWIGDHLAPVGGYDGFNIPDTDNRTSGTHGSCEQLTNADTPSGNGGYVGQALPPCNKTFPVYIEPASGFWIQNPGTALINNAIGGCQGVGRAYWWVPPGPPIQVKGKNVFLGFAEPGTFMNNRGHSCYAGFYGESEYSVVSQVLTPHAGSDTPGASIVATFDQMTATRNRFRGVWLRPDWVVVKNGRFATNRENVSLVTSGGIDGNAPGVWDLLADSTIVGMSQNNVDRFGPCPVQNQLGPFTGADFGCIDHTPAPKGEMPHSADEVGQGYSPPSWNFFGYMLYDGPVRVFHDRFVNFNYDTNTTANGCATMPTPGAGCQFSSQLDKDDLKFLINYEATFQTPTGQGLPINYEGDAVFGWFQSNQSSYPTGTVSRQLMFDNTNLRHQIYTELVSLNLNFNDGDKNTAIIDEDGTLAGLGVQVGDPINQPNPVYPISLNNLPFNGTSNSVDECLSRGGQNQVVEGRDTSLMSPGTLGTLEFSTLHAFATNVDHPKYPGIPTSHWQLMTVKRDDVVPNGTGGTLQPSITLSSRAGRGLWEPKVTSGFGYTVGVAPIPTSVNNESTGKAGIGKWIDVGIADVVDPNISSKHPFFIRLGICYTNSDTLKTHPQDPAKFIVKRGFKSFDGGSIEPTNTDLRKYWTPLKCNNIDVNNRNNIPWEGNSFTPACPSAGPGQSEPETLTLSETGISGLTNNDGTPNLKAFWYDKDTGMLYLNVAQDEPNPLAPSPTGSCNADGTGDPSCPNLIAPAKAGDPPIETYYACPKDGCPDYTIEETDPEYLPGESSCNPYPTNAQNAPANQNQLVLAGTTTIINQMIPPSVDKQGNPYNTATNGPTCPATSP